MPGLGGLALAAVEPRHVLDLHHGLSDRPAMANMTVAVLSHMYKLAEGWGMVADGVNPCGSVARYPAKRRERFLTDAEFEKLGQGAGRGGGGGAARRRARWRRSGC